MGLREQGRRMGVTAQKASSAFSAGLKDAHSIYFGLEKAKLSSGNTHGNIFKDTLPAAYRLYRRYF
jgi:hypothetical protein